jgi:hypothetical protein
MWDAKYLFVLGVSLQRHAQLQRLIPLTMFVTTRTGKYCTIA